MALIPSGYKNVYGAWAKHVFRQGSNVTDAIGRGFSSIITAIEARLKEMGIFNLPKTACFGLLNDFDLVATKLLYDRGYRNIYHLVYDDSESQAYSKYMFQVKYQDKAFKKMFPEGLTFWKQVFMITKKEVHDVGPRGLKKSTHTEFSIEGVDQLDLKFDGIITNPPYGKVGAQLTDFVRQYVRYDTYLNILPANDYKRVTGLHQYTRGMKPINKGFVDAAVTTHMCEVVKEAADITVEEFEISQYLDSRLTKYFTETERRTHYAIDKAVYKPKLKNFSDFSVENSFFIGKRYISDEHIPYTKKALGYLWNVTESITHEEALAMSAKSEQALGNAGDFCLIKFNTSAEKQNIANFFYGTDAGFKFFAKLVVALNKDSWYHPMHYIPKVDWTRSWTVEEILADYGYTADEIAEVMSDLNKVEANGKPKYRGLED